MAIEHSAGLGLKVLLGVSLFSAIGSLSLHLTPFFTAALIAEGRVSVSSAGWLRTIAQAGEFLVAFGLPLLGVGRIRLGAALLGVMTLLGGFALSLSQDSALLLLGWLVIGASSALLKYLGTTALSRHPNLRRMFSARLAIVLLLAGATSCFLLSRAGLTSYQTLLLWLGLIVLPVMAVSTALYATPQISTGSGTASSAPFSAAAFVGLVVVLLYFVGLSGVLVYVLYQAPARGLSVADAGWAVAIAKIAAGVWLLVAIGLRGQSGESRGGFVLQSAILAVATGSIYLSQDMASLIAALVAWEIAGNVLAARIQAAVVQVAPGAGGQWLNAAILTGGAIGPPLNGFAVSLGVDWAYVALGVVTAMLPPLWYTAAQQKIVSREAQQD